MLVHHSNQDYEVAASAAAAQARQKMEAIINAGKAKALRVIDHVQTNVPQDRLVRVGALHFLDAEQHDQVEVLTGTKAASILARFGQNGDAVTQGFHRHALGQVAGRVGVPQAYLNTLLGAGPWGADLAAHNLNEMLAHAFEPNRRFLVRSVMNEVRGFLSDRYRRLDSRPIVETFAMAANAIGAVPVEGYISDTRIALKAMLPLVFEPVPHEVMCLGAILENSDFGNGALSIRTFMLRLWCTNYAISDVNIREVHLGGQLHEDITWSDKTYQLDTERSCSMVNDIVKGQLAPPAVDRVLGQIRLANEMKLRAREAVAILKRTQLLKGEVQQVVDAYNSPDVENLPAGNTPWRLSNAISWVAGTVEDTDRKLDLMKVAGAVLPKIKEEEPAQA